MTEPITEPTTEDSADTPDESSTGSASYIYLAARDIPDDAVTDLAGLEGQPVRLVRNAGLTAVVSTVDLADYGEQGLRRNLEDLGWLERVARTHDDVVHHVGRQTAVAPWRLATIMLDDARVAQLLAHWSGELQASLDRVEGCSEWSVKMLTDLATEQGAEDEPAASGTAYLQRRRAEYARHTDAQQRAAVAADEIHAALSRLTAASRRLPPQDRRLTGHRGEMMLNGAYLVADDQSEQFTSLVEQLGADLSGSRLELGGPWPPYSFATLETRTPQAGAGG
ncbi:GvpL/GvpF family gas vesicle protein [Microlunatus sp. Gsoil 973]|uniref:GvpL/GvpF family gas vesicle protein n=1 Tax=Microlunatus sp. Gsoil 973 TaxID=2672569 RepID=UPI0012B4D377|nr:GvpL/GvpF family gas vesicle protein [Microlunatus sp. Gsoil 973]QGN31965.1 gas vesicle protein GvpFL [Microlunatus sp. Gsoil 973]